MMDKRIKITLAEEEHEQIKRNAQFFGMNVSQYLRMITLEPDRIDLSYPCIKENTEYIHERSNNMLKSLKQLIKDVEEQSKERKKLLPKMIRKMLKEKRERYK